MSQIRAEWALCVGFKKIIAFAEYLALHDNADGRAHTAYDFCSVPSRDKCTRFIGNPAWDELPVLIESCVGLPGLTMKLPNVLYYLGTECVQRKRFKNVDPEMFALTLEFEMVACALYVDYRHGQVWIMEASAVVLLENNSQAPEIVIGVLAQASRRALALPGEYVFERLDFCSQHRVRLVAHDQNGAFIKPNDYRGPRFKSKPVIPPSRPAPQVPGTEYVGGFGSGPAPTLPLRSKPAQSSSRGAPRGLLASRGNQDSRLPVPSAWDGVYSDDSIRANANGELVVRGFAPRPGGWVMFDILCQAAEIICARDNTIFGSREDQARLEQEPDRPRNRGSWNQGHGYGYQEPKRQHMRLDAPRYESVRPSVGGSMVTAEGRGAPPGYTPYRASTPGPAESRDVQVYNESANRGDYYANYVREHGRADVAPADPYASRGRAPSAARRLSSAQRAEILRRNPYADV